MNHKVTMFKLEDLKQKKLHEARELQKEISKIEESISYHRRMYRQNEIKADKAKEVLAGRSRETIREIIKFLIGALKNGPGYFEYYKDIDLEELLDNDEFFDFAIVEIGAPTIKNITDKFEKVVESNGEKFMVKRKNTRGDENTRNRIWKKFTKKTITDEAKRILAEKDMK